MRRPLPFLLLALSVAAVAVGAVVAATPGSGPGAAGGSGTERPTSFSASVASPSAAASANWGNRSAAASADPSRWGEVRDREDARRSRARTTRRLARLVLASSARRLDVEPAELRAAVRAVARAEREEHGARRPRRAELTALRDRLAAALARELGVERAEVLRAARAELGARLARGVDVGLISEDGRRLALDCFDAPSACDVTALRRALRFGRLLGR